MKLKDGFVTHEMGGEQVMVSTGSVGFAGLVRSNATAAFIVKCLEQDTTRDAVVDALLAKYDVSADIAGRDVDKVLDKLRAIGALDE